MAGPKVQKIKKIISGGQTGVDRAALDFALENKIPCGGWCPRGKLAEDGEIAKIYPLKETRSSRYEKRTKKNVESADGTLIIINEQPLSDGTSLTMKICEKLQKPFLIIDSSRAGPDKKAFWDWVASNNISVLNVAGPRESSAKGIYGQSKTLLSMLWY